jgi:hypothetical protein
VAADGNKFTFSDQLPVVSSISPSGGSIQSGAPVTIHGSGFMRTLDVLFGTRSAGHLTKSDTEMEAYPPWNAVGTVDVTIVSTTGESLPSSASKYTYADCGVRWRWINPDPPGTYHSGLTSSGALLVSVGNGSPILSSPDGHRWTPRRDGVPFGTALNAVAWGNGRFVAVGSYGTILWSSDGIVWHDEKTVTQQHLRGIAYGGGLFVAVGDGSVALSSSDGQTWTLGSAADWPLYAVTYAAGRWVAQGLGGRLYTSVDGAAWSPTFYAGHSLDISGVIFGGPPGHGKFLAGVSSGGVLYSPDGLAWTLLPGDPFNPIYPLIYFGGRFLGTTADNRLAESADGLTWTILQSLPVPVGLMVTHGAKLVGAGVPWFLTSPDGANWTVENQSVGAWPLEAVVTLDDRVVAVGDGGAVVTSPDGENWSACESGVGINLLAVTCGLGRFVAAGADGKILTSPDGTDWTEQLSGTSATLSGIRFVNSAFWAVGAHGTVLSSPDGEHWTPHDVGATDDLSDVACGSGKYVIVSLQGNVYTSTDGRSWRTQRLYAGPLLKHVLFDGNRFVATGREEWSSTNGTEWSRTNQGQPYVDALGFHAGLWAGAYSGWGFATSTDGLNWFACNEPFGGDPLGMGNSKWGLYVVSGGGQIIFGKPTLLLSSVSPNSSPAVGGTDVQISGRGFLRGAIVKVGGLPASAVNVSSGTSLTATVPPHAEGIVDVEVVNPDGERFTLASAFTYGSLPTISSVVALANPLRLKISGTRFASGCSVAIDGHPAPTTLFKTETALVAKGGAALAVLVPKGKTVQITVANPAGAGTSAPFPFTR